MRALPWHWIAALGIAVAGVGILAVIAGQHNPAQRDFIEYWTVGQQLLRGQNPYDEAANLALQRGAGLVGDHPLTSLSPPVAFFLVVPLGIVNANTGLLLWLIILAAGFVASIRMLRAMHGRPDNRLHLICYCFAPVMFCLETGQLGIFFLVGITLFLYYHQSRPFLAGAALLPCALKPHLFMPFVVVLLLWMVSRRAYSILAGFSIALIASCSFTIFLDHQIWPQYLKMMHTAQVLNGWVPSLSATLRFLVDRQAVWLEFAPEVAACGWAMWYFWTRRDRWNWMDQGLLVMLVSAACAPYSWFTDEAMLVPAVLVGIYRADKSGRSLLPFGFLAGIAMIEVIAEVPLTSVYYLWTTPSWIVWYLYASGNKGAQAKRLSASGVEIASPVHGI